MPDCTRICPRCSETKQSSEWGSGQSYCRECFREYKRARRAKVVAALPPRLCSECASEFRSPYVQTITCSKKCGTDREWRLRGTLIRISELPPRECAECGKAFTMLNTVGKFCSVRCRETARNSRRIGFRVRKSTSLLTRLGAEAYAEYRVAARAKRLMVENAAKARWALANKARVKATTAAWIKAHPERSNEATRRYRANKRAAFTIPFTEEQLASKLSYWGRCCWMCGANATSVDHVKPLSKSGSHILANFRPACGPCNSAKGARWFGVSELYRFTK
jgi:5-methylcytosine-specific restriction endonuclease McrA